MSLAPPLHGAATATPWPPKRAARCDLYLLTGDEIPFIQDGLRDGEHIRHTMHTWFEDALREQSVPRKLLRGTREERMAEATAAVDEMFARSGWRARQPAETM